MIADKLRAAILQAAISGQLTKQRPEDGTAAELLEQIAAERAALVEEKKLKKQKSLPSVKASDQPLELPDSWVWANLGEVIELLSGRDLTPEQYSDLPAGIPYITGASNFNNGSLSITRWTEKPVTIAHRGDLLITCKGTIGDLAVLEEPEVHVARQVMAISCIQVRRDYVAAFLEYSVSTLKAQAKSMIPGISRDMLLRSPLALPPLAEQERIISKLDEVLPLIDQLAELERASRPRVRTSNRTRDPTSRHQRKAHPATARRWHRHRTTRNHPNPTQSTRKGGQDQEAKAVASSGQSRRALRVAQQLGVGPDWLGRRLA